MKSVVQVSPKFDTPDPVPHFDTPDPVPHVVQIAPIFDAPDEGLPVGQLERRSTDQRQLLLAAMLVASSDDAIIGKDQLSAITTWNPAAQRLYGYSAEEVVGRNIAFLLPPDRINELDAVLGQVARGAGAQHYETKRVHKDGHLIEVGMTVSPIRDQSGAIVGTSTIQRDITQRKQTDAVIVEMAVMVGSSNDAIIGKTLEGVITTWNRGAENIYGYTADEMIGKSISLIVPPDRPGEVAA